MKNSTHFFWINFPESCNCLKCARGRVSHTARRTLQAAYSANVDQVNNAKIQTDVTSKQMFCLCTYLYQLVEYGLYTPGCINDFAFT